MKTTATELNRFKPAIYYGRTLGKKELAWLRISFFIIFVGCASTIAVAGEEASEMLLGLTLIFFTLWVEQMLLLFYHNSFYFQGFDSTIASGGKDSSGLSYEAAQIMLTDEHDLTGSFIKSKPGYEILLRCGIGIDDLAAFVRSNRTFIPAVAMPLKESGRTTIADISSYIYMYDVDFKNFLSGKAVSSDLFYNATNFVIKKQSLHKKRERWWSRDRLSINVGIGRSLATGVAYELGKYSYPLFAENQIFSLDSLPPLQKQMVRAIEDTLARDRAANILLLNNSGYGQMDLLDIVQKRVRSGLGLNALVGLEFYVLDTQLLTSQFTESNALENEILYIFDQAAKAGNIVIVIDNISSFMSELKKLSVDFADLIDVYLSLPSLHLIGIDSIENFHLHLRGQMKFVRQFAEMTIDNNGIKDTVAILEPLILKQESIHGVLFTYDAIVEIARSADRYIADGALAEKSINILNDILQIAKSNNELVITTSTIHTYISTKTGVPVGPISEDEKDKLLNLEQILHTRVVGQDEAINAIASTMRRARVDVSRDDKPIGSFLFLGPTGVGKTETAKVLALTFFGQEEKMVRLDMSEFSNADSLAQLMGDETDSGILANQIHEHPYCVLLLDEFEKAHVSIHDLFLQILDEGYFTNHQEKKINLRNTIIIATSNAGSDLITKTRHIRQDNKKFDAEIVEHVIKNKIFRPELINRFDNTIIFESLNNDEQCKVAELLLQDLQKRIAERGYTLKLSREVTKFVADSADSGLYGGRGISRFIQDRIEEKIATMIIAGVVEKGGTIQINHTDLEEISDLK